MAGLGLDGVFSGIDTTTLVNHTLAVNSVNLARLADKKAGFEAELSAVDEFEGRLGDLRYQVDMMRNVSDLRFVDAYTSDSTVAHVSISEGMSEGVHQIEVDALASTEKRVHAGLDSRETWLHSVGAETADAVYVPADEVSGPGGDDYRFAFQFGIEPAINVDLSVYAETGVTLNELVTEINMQAGYAAASAVEDGGKWKLMLEAQSVGPDTALTITDDNSVAMLDSTDDFARKAAGGEATDPLVGQGQFVYTYNGQTATVTTTKWTTLGDLVNLINNDTENPGVSASILSYDGAEGGEYHLVFSGRDSGADYAISIDSATTLSGFAQGQENWTVTQTAQNSRFRIDGYPQNDWIERSGNVVTDAIAGGTLVLDGTGTTSITLTKSTETVKTYLTNIVAVFNGLKMKIDEFVGRDEDTGVSGVLQGDYFLNSIYNELRAALVRPALGFGDSDSFTMAAQIGLEVDRYGEFSFDEAVFDAAAEDDYEAVLSVVAAVSAGTTSSDDIQFAGAADSTQGGVYDVQIDYDADGNVSAGRIKLEGESNYRDMEVVGDSLIGSYGQAEQYLELNVLQGGLSETRSYTVRVKQGFAGEIYNRLQTILDEEDGSIAGRKESYTNQSGWGLIDITQEKIEREQTRLEQMEIDLTAKYARLETTLAQLDSQRGAFDAMFSSLEANNSDD